MAHSSEGPDLQAISGPAPGWGPQDPLRSVRIGAGMGFYGDSALPVLDTIERGQVRYLSFDHLAELTMAILQKDRQKDHTKGYTRDIGPVMRLLLKPALQRGIRLITNSGGLNPRGARAEIGRVAQELGVAEGLRVAVVEGDDLMGRLDELQAAGVGLDDLETGRPLSAIRDRLLFANAYLGAWPVVEALRQGAHVVVTGRVADPSLFLAPLAFELGWSPADWDRLSLGILLGHIMECSGQVTGGNFSGRWWEVPDLDRIGYPVAQVREDGEAILTKPEGTGGLVSVDTVKEQLLYEITDPSRYLSPDVSCDWSNVRLEDAGPDRVRITGARGRERPPTLKVIMGYHDGWMGQGMIGFSWPEALSKARAAERIIRRQMERVGLKVPEEAIHVEYLGVNALHGPVAPVPDEDQINEVFLRIAVRTESQEDAAKLGRLFPPLALNGPPFIGGLGGMQPVRELLGIHTALIPRELVEPHVRVSVEEAAAPAA